MSEPLIRFLFMLHLASTLFMLGVIWFVQVVHYPLFAKTGADAFPAYEQAHATLTTWVVATPMLVEATTAGLLLWLRPEGLSNFQCVAGVVLVAVIWLATMRLQVPCHRLLTAAFDAKVHQRLVSTNWLRTTAWSLRGLLVLWMFWSIVK